MNFAAPPHDANHTKGQTSVVGVISDTHGLLRPEALTALDGCQRIIHAGDLGKPEIFEKLSRIAPTVAVRGNMDCGPWADAFPETLSLSINGVNIYVLHDLKTLDFNPVEKKVDLVVSGHSHQPVFEEQAEVLYLNPGSAGPRRFSLPVTVAVLKIGPQGVQAEIIDMLNRAPLAL